MWNPSANPQDTLARLLKLAERSTIKLHPVLRAVYTAHSRSCVESGFEPEPLGSSATQ